MNLSAIIDRSHKESEVWKYTNLDALARKFSEASVTHLANDSEIKAVLRDLTARVASEQGDDVLRLAFVDGFYVTNPAAEGFFSGDAESGYHLRVNDQTCLATQPIELVFLTTLADIPREQSIRFSVDVGDNSRLTLLERTISNGSPLVQTFETNIYLHPQAKLVHGKIIEGDDQFAHLSTSTVDIAKGAFYDAMLLMRGGKPTRHEIDIRLNGSGAQADIAALLLGSGQAHDDFTCRIHHNAPDCASRQICRAVLTEKAHGVFQGKTIVAEDAQKTDGYQLCRSLLLSDQAEMNAKPELEIYADDVKCSHGCASGDLDDAALFYLRARGVSEKEARALLIRAFLDDVIDAMPIAAWQTLFHTLTDRWLHDRI